MASLDGEFLVLGLGLDPDPAAWPGMREDAARLLEALAPWATGRKYLAMLDDRTDSRKALPPEVHARLSAVRRAVDPAGLFVAQHS